ncbi:peptidyl-prolyl cis-trans isomerase [Mucisphaera calidilacus]|nr:peptidylprolyl isomerase [Mucisphaera calidilacus]
MRRHPITCLLLALILQGCADRSPLDTGLSDDDFVAERPSESSTPEPQAQPETQPVAAEPLPIRLDSSDLDEPLRQPQPQPDTARSWTIDGMVGQVNGRAIYARTVLEPLELLLARNARELDARAFEREAQRAVAQRLREIVQNRLMLASAERDLNEQQRMILDATLRYQRDELIRQYGRGSLAVAEQQLMLREGLTLDEKIEEYRQQFLIRGFQVKHLRPMINVRRHDIERYYREHYDDYNPPVEQTIRMIRVSDEKQAERVLLALASDYTFEEVANTPVNQMLGGGRFDGLIGEQPLKDPILNEAIASLESGDWAGPIVLDNQYTFIELVERHEPEAQTLTEAQREIREALVSRQLRTLSTEYQQKLMTGSNYTPVEQMLNVVMDIVMTRYAITTTTAASP